MNTKQIKERAKYLVSKQSTARLAATLLSVEAQRTELERNSDAWKALNRTFLWIAEELESRYDVTAAMDAWADDENDTTYAQALIAALPMEALS